MSATYFWDGEQLIVVPEQVWMDTCEPYLDMPCVDTFAEGEGKGRYGVFTENPSSSTRQEHWCEYKVDELPKEFRANLLLLGVS